MPVVFSNKKAYNKIPGLIVRFMEVLKVAISSPSNSLIHGMNSPKSV